MNARVSVDAEAVERFLNQLNAEGWKIGADQYIAASNVMLTLTTTPELLGRGSVVDWLAPVICRSRADQQTFRERFRTIEENAAAPADADTDTIVRTSGKMKGARAARGVLIAVALAFVLLGTVSMWLRSDGDGEVGTIPIDPQNPNGTQTSLSSDLGYVDELIVAAFFLGAFASFFKRRRQHDLSKTLARDGDVTHHFPKIGTSIFLPSDFRRMTQRLRRRRQIAASDLNVDRTVDVTARCGGFFTPVYATRGMTPEYLALVDRSSVDDQQALLHRAVLDRVRSDDVIVDIYEFHGDPRICWREGREDDRCTLDDLISRHFDRTLLLFADGDALLHPLTRAPYRWTEMMATSFRSAALLTSRPTAEWDDAEWRLARAGLLVLPSTTAGLTALVESLERPANAVAPDAPAIGASSLLGDEDTWTSNFPAEPERVAALIAELESRFGEDGMNWLAACAVYPAMHWYLTLYLGSKLNVSDMERKLVELVRLPWFRRGVMPDWLRSELILTLPRPSERAIRQYINELFAIAVNEQRGGSPIHLVTFNDLKNAAPDDSPLREYVLVRFMSGQSPKMLAVRIREMFEGVRNAVRERQIRRDPAWRVLTSACVPFFGFFATMGKATSTELRWHAWNAATIVLGAGLLMIPWLELMNAKKTPFPAAVAATSIATLALAGRFALRGGRLRIPVLSRLADHMTSAEQGEPLNRALRLLILLASYSNPLTASMAAGIRIPDIRWHARAGLLLSASAWIVFGVTYYTLGSLSVPILLWSLLAVVLIGTFCGMRQRALPYFGGWSFPAVLPARDRTNRVPFIAYPLIALGGFAFSCTTWMLGSETLSPLSALYRDPLESLPAIALVFITSLTIGRKAMYAGGVMLIVAVAQGTSSEQFFWLSAGGISLLVPHVIAATAESTMKDRRNPAPALSALAVISTLAVIVTQVFKTELQEAQSGFVIAGLILLLTTFLFDAFYAFPQPAVERRGSASAVLSMALLAFVAATGLGMFMAGLDDFTDELALLGMLFVVVLPMVFVTYLATAAHGDPAKRIANALVGVTMAAVCVAGLFHAGALWANRQGPLGSSWEAAVMMIAIFTGLVMLIPAGWLYASTVGPRLRATTVAAWNALIIGGCALGTKYAAMLESPVAPVSFTLIAVAYFQQERIAVQFRLAADVIRRWAATPRRPSAAASTPSPAQ